MNSSRLNSINLLATTLIVFIFHFAAQAQDASGIMMVVKGDIKVTAKDGKTEPAKVGKKVVQGDSILAGADSRAKIVMSDKNVINISPDSKIVIEKYENDGKDRKNVELNVVYGKVRASVEQKYDGEKNTFNIKTPSAVAGVRGTDFITGYNPGTRVSQIITFSGTVAVGQPGPNGSIRNPVFVQPGQMTEAGAGAPPAAPKPVPKEELNKMNSESKADLANNKQDQGPKDLAKDDKKEKKDEEKKDAKNPGNPDQRGPANDPNAPQSDPQGNPQRGPSMFVKEKDDPVNVPKDPILPFMPPPPPMLPPPPNSFINDAIRNNQKSRTTIILSPQ